MNSRWRQQIKILKQWNNEIQKSLGNKHQCLSKTERKRIKEGTRYLRKFEMEFEFDSEEVK